MKISHSVARIFFYLSAALFVVAVVTGAFSLAFHLRSNPATAIVSGYETSDRSIQLGIAQDGGIHYFPVFTFAVEDGRNVEFTSGRGRMVREYIEGEAVPVRYIPDNPENARTATLGGLYGTSLAWTAVAALFLLCALVFRFRFDER
ncbi:DUF3592 domain-containing protein [Spirochaeta dissipatitropha]